MKESKGIAIEMVEKNGKKTQQSWQPGKLVLLVVQTLV